jgi:tetratricopeptide (TPR) repeat protein
MLRVELGRLAPLNPFEILRITTEATQEQVRAAFLAATKKYHPNRFARESPETLEAANEIFLLIRRAYGLLSDETRRKAVRHRVLNPTEPMTPARSRGIEAAPSPIVTGTTVPLPPTIPSSLLAPPPARVTPPLGLPTTNRLAPPTQPPMGAPVRQATPTPAQSQTVTPVPATRQANTPRPRPPTMPAPAPATPAVSPQTGRSQAEVKALLESTRTRQQRYEQACRFLLRGRTHEAKTIFTQLAGEDPQSRKFRARVIHAAAVELREEGKIDDAIRELERAVQVDPELADMQDALKKLVAERGKGGIFSKIFGR